MFPNALIDLVLLMVVGAGAFYLLGRAQITRPIWSRFPDWLGRLTGCAACSGFWLGGVFWCVYLGAPVGAWIYAFPIGGLLGLVLVPIGAAVLSVALELNAFMETVRLVVGAVPASTFARRPPAARDGRLSELALARMHRTGRADVQPSQLADGGDR